MTKNYLIIKYEDLSNITQSRIDVILEARARNIAKTEVENGNIDKEDFNSQVEKLISQMIDNIWTELEV